MKLLEKINQKIVHLILKVLKTEECDTETFEKSKYMISCIVTEVEKICFLIVIFLTVGRLSEFLVALITVACVRSFVGGFHCKTTIGCILSSLCMFSLIMLVSENIKLIPYKMLVIIAFAIIIWKLAPIQSKYRVKYNSTYRLKFRYKAVNAVLIISLLIEAFETTIGNLMLAVIDVLAIEVIMASVIGRFLEARNKNTPETKNDGF